MNQKLQSLLEQFDQNNAVLMKKYWAHSQTLSAVASTSYFKTGKAADPEELKNCEKIINSKFGIFSNIRGLMEIPLISEMANRPDPEAYITGVGEIYDTLKQSHFFHSDFDVLSASMLYNFKDEVNIDDMTAAIMRIYKKMQANHPMLTSHEDFPTATLVALSGKGEDEALTEMEECYQILKPHFGMMGEQVQTLCAILATQEGTAKEKCDRVLALYEALKAKGYSLRFSYALPILAGLCGLKAPVDSLVTEVCEAAEWLKGKKGFGVFGMGKEERISFAMLIYLESVSGSSDTKTAFMSSTLTSLIMVQIIINIIIMMMIINTINNANNSSN